MDATNPLAGLGSLGIFGAIGAAVLAFFFLFRWGGLKLLA